MPRNLKKVKKRYPRKLISSIHALVIVSICVLGLNSCGIRGSKSAHDDCSSIELIVTNDNFVKLFRLDKRESLIILDRTNHFINCECLINNKKILVVDDKQSTYNLEVLSYEERETGVIRVLLFEKETNKNLLVELHPTNGSDLKVIRSGVY